MLKFRGDVTPILFLMATLSVLPAHSMLPSKSKDTAVGIVDRCSEGWTRGPGGPLLKAGDMLKAGDRPFIHFSNTAQIQIAIFNRTEKWRKVCTATAPCEGPYDLPGPDLKTKDSESHWTFLIPFWHSEEKIPSIFAGSRSLENVGLQHAMLSVTGAKMDIKEALEKMPPGDYTLIFSAYPLSRADTSHRTGVHWDGGSALFIDALPSGLYVLDILNLDGERLGSHAAALIVPAADVSAAHTWRDAKQQTSQWSGVSEATTSDLLLTTLIAIHTGAVSQ